MLTSQEPPVVVIACGEPLRGDDGVAHAALDRLPPEARRGVAIRHVTALAPEDLAGLEPEATAIVLDAVVGIPVGEIVCFDLDRLPTHAPVRPTSSHRLPLDIVIGLARFMGWKPCGTFIGIGAARFGHGSGLSPRLERRLPEVAEVIATEIERTRPARLPVPAP